MSQAENRSDSNTTSAPTVGQQFVTGQQGEAIFKGWLPETWLARKQEPDFFVDYLVEVVENGEPTGRKFAVQVKGVKVGDSSATPLKFSANGKHARYWLEKCQHPVFVFLIDVTKRTGHWLFVQKYLRDHVAKAALERQKSMTLRFDPKDNLNEREAFIAQLPEAEKYAKDLHPGSAQAALVKAREELEKLEPRLGYGIVASETGQIIHLSVKEPFGFSLFMEGEYAKLAHDAFKAVVEHGQEFRFPTEGVKFTGSPLFERLSGKPGELVLKLNREIPGVLLVQILAGAKLQSLPINGAFRVGTKTATFRGEIPNAPFRIEATFDLQSKPENMPTEIVWSMSLDKWRGQPVVTLAYFELIKRVIKQMLESGGLQIEWLIDGNSFAEGFVRHPINNDTSGFSEGLAWISRLRAIAEKYKPDLMFPGMKSITQKQFESVNELATLMTEGELTTSCPKFQAKVALSNYQDGKFEFPAIGTFGFDTPEAVMEVLGHKFTFESLRTYFTHTKVSEESVNAKGHRVLTLLGNESSQRIIKRYTPVPGQCNDTAG
ncbi:MAG: DUF4365 domain-containing protein [Verrucomicrobiota bacterium]